MNTGVIYWPHIIIIMSENYDFKWNEFSNNVTKSFAKVRDRRKFHDVTLVSEDMKPVQAHKLILSASSLYFNNLLSNIDQSNQPLICLDGISSTELNNILEYIYMGSVKVCQADVGRFLLIAQKLKLKGLKQEENKSVKNSNADALKIEKDDNITLEEDQEESQKEIEGDCEGKSNLRKDTQYQKLKFLEDHIKVTEDKQYECKLCGKICNQKNNMRNHVETHVDGISYKCEFCGKNFRTRNSQRVHITTQHKVNNSNKVDRIEQDVEEIFECEFCGKGYKNDNSRRVHVSIIHKIEKANKLNSEIHNILSQEIQK